MQRPHNGQNPEPVPAIQSNGLAYLDLGTPPPPPSGPPVPTTDASGLVYLEVDTALPVMPRNAEAPVDGATLLDVKQLRQLRTNILALRIAVPLVMLTVTFVACSAIADDHQPMLIVGLAWAAISWPLISWSVWKYRQCTYDLAHAAIAVQGGIVAAKSVLLPGDLF